MLLLAWGRNPKHKNLIVKTRWINRIYVARYDNFRNTYRVIIPTTKSKSGVSIPMRANVQRQFHGISIHESVLLGS